MLHSSQHDRRARSLPLLAAGLVCGAAHAGAGSQSAQVASLTGLPPSLTVTRDNSTPVPTMRAHVQGAAGSRFMLSARYGVAPDAPTVVLGIGPLDGQGQGTLEFDAPRSASLAGSVLELRADYMGPDGRAHVDRRIGVEPPCERLNFNFALGEDALEAGTVIDEQWSEVGLHVAAQSNGGDDAVILFDSANPTSNDDDLVTPGPGAGNDTALGMVLIIADDLTDADNDGLVDDPGDEELGGSIHIRFDEPATLCSLGLLDLDKGGIGSTITFYDNVDNEVGVVFLPSAGDNSFQDVVFFETNVSRLEIDLVSSGALPYLDIVPCPSIFRFDRNTFGAPNGIRPGEQIDGEVLQFGLQVEGSNNIPGHPDMVVLFNSDDPTGEDDDLQTPGPGVGNDVAHRGVLIIPEDAQDTDGDDLIDDPDDEAAGGTMRFDFPSPREFRSATVLDIDGSENSFMVFYDAQGQQITTAPLANLGDNSAQKVEQTIGGVQSIELILGGSGALAELVTCPAPVLAMP